MSTIPEISIHDQLSLPKLGIGTWEMGGRQKQDIQLDNHWINALIYALDAGIRHIDTAAIYGGGHAEELVGRAIKGFKREQLLITTKVSGDNLGRDMVRASAEKSLKRLETDYIDLFLIHWPNPAFPLSETMAAINQLLAQKTIRHFGLSNFPVHLIREVMQLTDAPIMTNQIEFNLLTRNKGSYNTGMEAEIIPFCQQNGISVTAWRPVMKGLLDPQRWPLIVSLARKYDRTVFQIAINWLISKPLVVAIPKMSDKKHIDENIAATQFVMQIQDYVLLDEMCY